MMRKFLLIIVFMATSIFGVFAQESLNREYWEPVMNAIVQVESGGNCNAVNGKCVGPMQISPGMVTSINNIMKRRGDKARYTLADRKNLEKSKEIFLIFQSEYNKGKDIEKAIRSWNGGLGYKVASTNGYYRKVTKQMAIGKAS